MVSVSGAALTPFCKSKDGSAFRDWAGSAFKQALAISTLDRCDIDMLVLASESDFFTLQLNPVSVIADDLGLAGCSTLRVEGGGASGQLAVHAGVRAILSGTARHVAVIGVDPSASQLSASAVKALYSFSFDAWSEGFAGVSATTLYALSVQGFMERLQLSKSHLAAVTIQNRENACANPNAHLGRRHTVQEIDDCTLIAAPYRRLHCSPLSDGAAAIILSKSGALPATRKTAPVILGIGASSDRVHLGARPEPDRFTAKSTAMKRACKSAGIEPKDIGFAEVYDAYAGAQLQAIEALGLSENIGQDLDAGEFGPTGRCPINLSGGLMGQGAPAGAIGVAQTANCALFLEGRNQSGLQPANPPRYALADTHGGICTIAAVTVLAQADAL